MNIFLTGGNGLIGKRVSILLEKRGHNVISFDKSIENKNRKKILFLKGDILEEKRLNELLKKYKIDILLHFAANLGVEKTEKNGLDCLTVNIEGTKNILKACSNNKVKRIIFASSSEVYGNGFQKPIRENSELMPKSSYGVSKVAGESYVKAFYEKYNLKYNILRFFNIYGPNQRNDFVISKFRKNIQNNKILKIYGKGKQSRAFCHVDDAARAVVLVMTKGKKNEVYNVGNDLEPITIENLAKKMILLSKKKIKIVKVPFNKSDRSLSREIFKRQPNIDKIQKHTKYKPIINLLSGLNSVLKNN
tara:strand:+ start:3110 stop:4024 length:915 start_codon:yes stop_codon:yes gene_type:complete